LRIFRVLTVALLTLAGSWCCYYAYLSWRDINDPALVATLIAISIGLHEFAHWVVLEMNRVRAKMYFIVVVGGVQPEDVNRYLRLHWSDQAMVAMAGLITNAGLIMWACVSYAVGDIERRTYEVMASINANLIWFNLIPFFITDGARLMMLLFDSTPEKKDGKLMLIIFLLLVGVRVAVYIGTGHFNPIDIFFFLWALRYRATHDKPQGSRSPKAMSPASRRRWVAVYVALLALAMYILAVTPSWL